MANLAILRTLGFPDGTVPNGFAVPFYFYDEFMKHNGFYGDIEEMLEDSDFQSDYDTQEKELKKLRKKIKKGETPEWIKTALSDMHATYPQGQSLRYRSSTNNEDLPGFNGAGLYDSKTQHTEETEEDGIDKSLKQVYASLWNFRAFSEREFHRIDHLAAMMGVLVHPNYSDELANGVAVSFNPNSGSYHTYYVNTQIGGGSDHEPGSPLNTGGNPPVSLRDAAILGIGETVPFHLQPCASGKTHHDCRPTRPVAPAPHRDPRQVRGTLCHRIR